MARENRDMLPCWILRGHNTLLDRYAGPRGYARSASSFRAVPFDEACICRADPRQPTNDADVERMSATELNVDVSAAKEDSETVTRCNTLKRVPLVKTGLMVTEVCAGTMC